ncbi:MAG: hypothetical protein F4018_00875 [Acidobacteria bacterium]|nr:hypothetical protein [Acidobacteriota bacterium]MYH31459.1 hypothetical protein [Acidobacteriota bacterium]MYK87006.1 hypothetical protein [Acidobacteriota bacterium]
MLVFKRDRATGGSAQSAGTLAYTERGTVDLDDVLPTHDPGPWPAGLSLRCEHIYDDRDR